MPGERNPLRSVRRWLVALASALPLLASFAAVTRERDRVCGSVPLFRCAVERLGDLYRTMTTHSCSARMLPAVRSRHRRIAVAVIRNGNRQLWLIEHLPRHASRLAACRLAKSSAGAAAVEEQACAEARESGHLLFHVAPAASRAHLLADTENELGCTYDFPAAEPFPARLPRRLDRVPDFSERIRSLPFCPPSFGSRACRRFRPPLRRAPAGRRAPSSS
jgi:hypothetical protein